VTEALANAKVNLSLTVSAVGDDGYHPIRSLAISVDSSDRLTVELSDEDSFECSDEELNNENNLAWRAFTAYRKTSLTHRPVSMRLDKRLPVAAGLGGGSADAAAALILAKEYFSAELGVEDSIAAELGSDIAFCLRGGLAMLEGRGNDVKPIDPLPTDFVLAIVTPPIQLSTGQVYRQWDDLRDQQGPAVDSSDLPPSMRDYPPLRNDLYPAAIALEPVVDEWRQELSAAWARPVFMTGSGPSLAAYFLDADEAEGAVAAAPDGHRAAFVAAPAASGVVVL